MRGFQREWLLSASCYRRQERQQNSSNNNNSNSNNQSSWVCSQLFMYYYPSPAVLCRPEGGRPRGAPRERCCRRSRSRRDVTGIGLVFSSSGSHATKWILPGETDRDLCCSLGGYSSLIFFSENGRRNGHRTSGYRSVGHACGKFGRFRRVGQASASKQVGWAHRWTDKLAGRPAGDRSSVVSGCSRGGVGKRVHYFFQSRGQRCNL